MTIPLKYKLGLDQLLWMMTGVLITMPVFTLPVGGVALYNVPFVIAIMLQPLRKNGRIYFYKIPLCLFIISLVISSVMCRFIVPEEWYTTSMRAVIKLVGFFLFMLLFFSDQELVKCRRFFMKGLLVAVPIQFFWIVLQSLCWSMLHVKLNSVIFGVKVYVEGTQGITLTGLSWERADTAFLFAIATAYSKNPYIRIMALIGTIMTTSRSGLLMIGIVYGYELLLNLPKLLRTIRLKSKTIFKIMCGVFALGILVVVLQYVHISAIDNLFIKLSQLIVRLTGIFTDTSEYGTKRVDPHKMYFLWLPNTLRQSSLHQLLIGSGTRISGWMYTQIYHRFPNYGPWNIECDFVSLLLGNGLLGFASCYITLLINFFITKSKAQKKIIILFLAGSLFYQFVSSTLGLLLIVFAFNNVEENEGLDFQSDKVVKKAKVLLKRLGIGEING